MFSVSVKSDIKGFERDLKEYLKYSKKDIHEIVATKAHYVSRNAVNETPAVDKQKIETELNAPSRIAPGVSLATILAIKTQKNKVMRERYSKKTGKRLKDAAGLYGDKITKAAEKLIRIRKNTTNFLRAGWIKAVQETEKYVPKKGGPPYKKSKVLGVPKGGAQMKKSFGGWQVSEMIWNSVYGSIKKHGLNKTFNPAKVKQIITLGLKKAIAKERRSMRDYIEKKISATNRKFNRR